MKIVILGAGPAGLGAGYRLNELGFTDYKIYEKEDHLGGLSYTHIDPHGFFWDIGIHLFYSHYNYIDQMIDKIIGGEINLMERKAHIFLEHDYVPYPFQNNFHHLPPDKVFECLNGLYIIDKNAPKTNFKNWIVNTFGQGIAKYFMIPYNEKIWQYPLEKMSTTWINERVSIPNVEKIIYNTIHKNDDKNWGPNNLFRYPGCDGIGNIFNKFIRILGDKIYFGYNVVKIDVNKKEVTFSNGYSESYDILINTSPIDCITKILVPHCFIHDNLQEESLKLKHNSISSIGLGFDKKIDYIPWLDATTIYYPEECYPFYRISRFDRFCSALVPNDYNMSLICEVSYIGEKSFTNEDIIRKVVEGLIKSEIIKEEDTESICSVSLIDASYAYPIPTWERDQVLDKIQGYLRYNNIYSIGRFGAWKYEIGNMDHSIMQGVDTVNKILGKPLLTDMV